MYCVLSLSQELKERLFGIGKSRFILLNSVKKNARVCVGLGENYVSTQEYEEKYDCVECVKSS